MPSVSVKYSVFVHHSYEGAWIGAEFDTRDEANNYAKEVLNKNSSNYSGPYEAHIVVVYDHWEWTKEGAVKLETRSLHSE